MNLNKLIPGIILLAAGAILPTSATAEIAGLQNGRSADLNNLPDSSIELGINFGDIDDFDYQYLGARYNYRLSPQLMAYADLGTMKIEDTDEIGFGIGAFYMLQDVLANADTAVKFSYHTVGGDIDVNAIALEAIVSGRNGLGSNPDLQWYGNFGISRLSGNGNSDTELLFGGGVVHPTQSGEVMVGLDHIDGLLFRIGYRHFLQ
ncbi:MAG: hypothetical protein V3U65_00150 [Granulosicoccaceae bacterium]